MHGFRDKVDFAVMAGRASRRLVGYHLVWPRRPASLSFCSFPGRLAGSRVHFVPLIIKVGKLVDCTEIVEREVRRPKMPPAFLLLRKCAGWHDFGTLGRPLGTRGQR